MSNTQFSPEDMIQRFQSRARAVKSRGIPPIEGPDRQRFVKAAQDDFMDFSIIGDATCKIEDGILTLTVDLRPNS
jgi:hypothetical protein